MQMRWLGRVPTIKERAAREGIRGSSVTFVGRGQPMADHIIRSGIRVLGRQYQVETFIEARPDTICSACSGWGHGEHKCAFSSMPRCALCAEQHCTADHRCPVRDCRAGCGSVCTHLIACCPNFKGPHGARSVQCPKKKEAQEKAKGWRGKKSMPVPNPTPTLPTRRRPHWGSRPQMPNQKTPCSGTAGFMPAGMLYRMEGSRFPPSQTASLRPWKTTPQKPFRDSGGAEQWRRALSHSAASLPTRHCVELVGATPRPRSAMTAVIGSHGG